MKHIKEIAHELSEGNIDKAIKIKANISLNDTSLQSEVVEIARQAIISYLKKGVIGKAVEITHKFDLPEDVLNETFKQAILSIYYDRNFKNLVKIRKSMPLSLNLRKEIVEYCDSWKGHKKEVSEMREVFLS